MTVVICENFKGSTELGSATRRNSNKATNKVQATNPHGINATRHSPLTVYHSLIFVAMFADDFPPPKKIDKYTKIRDFEAEVADRLLTLSGSFLLTHQGAIDHRVQGCAAPDCCIKGEQTHPRYQTLRSITSFFVHFWCHASRDQLSLIFLIPSCWWLLLVSPKS